MKPVLTVAVSETLHGKLIEKALPIKGVTVIHQAQTPQEPDESRVPSSFSTTQPLRLESLLVHPPGDGDPAFGDVVVPVHLTTTFEQLSCGQPLRYDYARGGNPTRQVLEDQIAALEGVRYGYAFGSGMAAVTAVLGLFSPGDQILIPNNVYGGTYRVLERYFKRFGLIYHIIDFTDLAAVEAALRSGGGGVKALLFESPTNPLLTVVDIAQLAHLAHDSGALAIVDNTFMTPCLQRPLKLGADIVLHSATKYLGGHSDVLAGLTAVVDPALAKKLHFLQYSTGAVLSPLDSFLLLRGIKTLSLRLERASASAAQLAFWLDRQPQVCRVFYPGLPNHPGYDLQTRQAAGYGALVSFEVIPDIEAQQLARHLHLIKLAESLGAVESLLCHPATMTHASVPPALRAHMGISDQLLRLSVGIEHPADLQADLAQALQSVG
ncbi:MAG: PLP-dependent aspartate aminotransferase family protein [Coriobacteriales bacterium]|nr:PLP-dependent aspartate aminotransferase family protein [Coriobacteriales bacterium]